MEMCPVEQVEMCSVEEVYAAGASYRDMMKFSGDYLKDFSWFLQNCSQEQFISFYESNEYFREIVNAVVTADGLL